MIIMGMTASSLAISVIILDLYHCHNDDGSKPVPNWLRAVVFGCLAPIVCHFGKTKSPYNQSFVHKIVTHFTYNGNSFHDFTQSSLQRVRDGDINSDELDPNSNQPTADKPIFLTNSQEWKQCLIIIERSLICIIIILKLILFLGFFMWSTISSQKWYPYIALIIQAPTYVWVIPIDITGNTHFCYANHCVVMCRWKEYLYKLYAFCGFLFIFVWMLLYLWNCDAFCAWKWYIYE